MRLLKLIGLKIRNYRSIKELPLNDEYLMVENFVTIIGKNDAGKSNILNAIRIVLEEDKVTKDDFHKGTNENIEISLIFDATENTEIMHIINHDSNETAKGLGAFFSRYNNKSSTNTKIKIKKIFEKDKLNSRNYKGDTIVEYFDEDKNKWVKIKDKKLINTILNDLPEVIYIPAIRDAIAETTQKSGFLMSKLLLPLLEKQNKSNSNEENGKEKQRSITELKKELQNLISRESKKLTKKILKELTVFNSSIEEIKIEPNKVQINFSPKIQIKDKYLPDSVPLEQRGAGLRSEFLLAMFRIWAEVGAGKGYILLFEEPELYLHPEAQKKMFSALKRISNEAQVLITTHSTIFVDRSDLKSIWLIRRENGETKITTFEKPKVLSEILEEIGATPSDLFLSNGVIYVEGKTEIKVFSKIAKAICPKWEEYNISIVSLGGGNIRDLSETLLFNGLASLNPNGVVVIDSDGEQEDKKSGGCKPKPEKLKIKENFEQYGLTVHILQRREIENYIPLNILEKYFIEGYIKSKYITKIGDQQLKVNKIKSKEYFKKQYLKYFKRMESNLREIERKQNMIRAINRVSPCEDILKKIDELLYTKKHKKWDRKKAEITPKLFEMMIKEKKAPLEFKEILEEAIRKCGFEPEFSDEFEYI
ncbi:predicted ATP-dependent endonuclease, OLD family [Thermococcus kodakarensis KOD1]|uniref:Predicted ATP-dependent endonuclease, OLD family n=1 Tax=Thermococcus kodakarensis (strain ATCC BAA-918 / JCM 12380 / KOD1) TaxID=69014 RepID=Q5JHA7_THEKO|nr:AAA family ATPase [Thermococcus kodakarensis]WCN29223.1 AAA family ATPase [Thermococcus kodakarensis]WCN31525.1 AAA family ATPase [Thermococcus kodakarensis]BAD84962.1 predicted ATP-dependent endonuclease, OLD family [Thermococcus kodakarensis KOD1]